MLLVCCFLSCFYGGLWCSFKRDNTYHCRQLFYSLRNRISCFANLKCDAKTAHLYASVAADLIFLFLRKLQKGLIVAMVVIHRMRNRGVSVYTSTLSHILSHSFCQRIFSVGMSKSRIISLSAAFWLQFSWLEVI